MNHKTAVVTGAGSGIGRAVALALLTRGWQVALAGRNEDSLRHTKALGGASDTQVLIVPVDVGRQEQVASLFQAIGNRWQHLDLLVNNAGVNIPARPLEEIALADWQRILQTNLTGAFLCTQAAFRMMKAQQPMGGRIINNGSVSAQVPRLQAAAYTSSKFALTGLTRATALEGRIYQIACGQIDIGNTDTNMAARMETGALQANGEMAIEPTFDVKHVVDAFMYMASLPLDVNVLSMTVMATGMPLVGRG